MDAVTALVLTVGSGLMFIAGAIVIQTLGLQNYFKKKTFTANLQQQKKLNKLKLDKLRKEMSLTAQKEKSENTDINNIIGELASKYLNTDEDYEDEGILDNIGQGIMNYAKENPELVKKVLGGVTGKKEDEEKSY